MKKRIICFILIFIYCFSFITVHSEELQSNSSEQLKISICVNNNTALINDSLTEISAPLIVFEEIYVNLYDFALPLGLVPLWFTDDNSGYLSINQPTSGITKNFTFIQTYDELFTSNKLFTKDGITYVSINDLADFAENEPVFNNGIVTLGYETEEVNHLYPQINLSTADSYIYYTYPKPAQYIVNPYIQYSYDNMCKDAKKLSELYPEIVKLSSIGQSVEGRNLLLIEFGRGNKKIFICGAHHAREYITTTYLMYCIDRYSYAYRHNQMWDKYNVREILDEITFCIVPMVNPDGVNIVQNGFEASKNYSALCNMPILDYPKNGYRAWKANANGVDVNWNYDKDWSISKNKSQRPASMGFNGLSPCTEPETRAVSEYVDSIPFNAFLSFHSQGQLIYYADDTTTPTNLDKLLKADTGFSFHYEKATGTGGSFFDYVYRKYGKVTITVELCPYVGAYPYPDTDFDRVLSPAKNIMLIVGSKFLQTKVF